MEFEGQSVLVLGLGLSGCSAVNYLAGQGARVVAADERAESAIADLDSLPGDIELRVGREFPALEDFDLVVPSPGVPAARFEGRARKAWGDIELCFRALRIPVLAVTGTNGKSTVVKLIEAMANAAGLRARAAGNLGVPALDLVGAPLDLAILEVSSFQLESVDAFAPRTGVLLNLSPDHLDRHGSMEGYRDAKARLFARQGPGQSAILNGDDPLCSNLALPNGVERLEFTRHRPVAAGAWLDGRNAIVRRAGRQQSISLEGAESLGPQDDNLLATLLALDTLDVDLGSATKAFTSFEGLPHRCETVGEYKGVRYVDDSKATNIGAARRSLEALGGNLIWIAGGRHKGGALDELAESAKALVKQALLIGEAAKEFEAALAPHVATEIAGDLNSAVARAAAIAYPGDVVLLAPACASFDQFKSFEARGNAFREAVKALPSSPIDSTRGRT